MDSNELKRIIKEMLNEGRSLDEIQKALDAEHDEKMTFFELKMLVSELDVDWSAQDGEDEKDEDDAEAKEKTEEPAAPAGTVVEISKLTRPGVALSGTVKFSSGASAEWILDQFGRLSFEKSDGEPTDQDLREFQEQLRAKLSRG